MIDKIKGEYRLICDICGEAAEEVFSTFDEAVDYKVDSEWISRKQDVEWADICPNCYSIKGVGGLQISELCQKAYQNAKEKGFWQDYRALECFRCHGKQIHKRALNNAIGNRLMLIVSEVGEALEALRQDDQDGFKEELADVAIRLGDLCGGLGIDLEDEIIKKMEKNKDRPSLHGKAF